MGSVKAEPEPSVGNSVRKFTGVKAPDEYYKPSACYDFPFLKADSVNSNNRVYPMSVCRKIIADFKASNGLSLMGQMGMPDDGITYLGRVSHYVKDIWLSDGGIVMATIQLLDTENGLILRRALAGNPEGSLALRSSGIGTIGTIIIGDDFVLNGLHIVPADKAATL